MSPRDTHTQNGNGNFPDLAALTARLEEFDRRIGETRQRTELLEQKTAAYLVGRVEAASRLETGSRPIAGAPAHGRPLTVSHATE